MSNENLTTITSYLTFRLGDEVFALNVSRVHKILGVTNITEVPRAPNYMKGVINLRGNVLPVVDTRVKFGMPPVEKTKSTSILVCEVNIGNEAVILGLLVDAVNAVMKLEEEDLLPPPSIGDRYKSEFISSMAHVKDKFVIVLNMDAVFSSEEQIDLKEIAQPRELVAKKSDGEKTDKKQPINK
jgi:purine-binding chemotaxis protein CheW